MKIEQYVEIEEIEILCNGSDFWKFFPKVLKSTRFPNFTPLSPIFPCINNSVSCCFSVLV